MYNHCLSLFRYMYKRLCVHLMYIYRCVCVLHIHIVICACIHVAGTCIGEYRDSVKVNTHL